MEKLVSVTEMQQIEREANARGLTYSDMMENAGNNLAFFINSFYNESYPRAICALVGSGNNGGDALVALRKLSELKWQTCAYLVKPRPKGDDQLQRYIQIGGSVIIAEEDKTLIALEDILLHNSMLLDGVFGTGVKFPLPTETTKILSFVRQIIQENKKFIRIIAVDCPSGIDCDTGFAAPEVIPANVTFTMAAIKRGFFSFPAANLIGEIQVGGIGDISGLDGWKSIKRGVLTDHDITNLLPARPRDAHKGTFGTVAVIAGSGNYPGAVILAGSAAYRSGAGLVKIAIPEYIYPGIVGQLIEATWVRLPHTNGCINEDAVESIPHVLDGANALLIGPGFGLEKTTYEFMQKFIRFTLPNTVIDADGLKHLASIPDWYLNLQENVVLTPHPGEMAILTGISVKEIQSNRLEVAETYAHQWRKLVVLKGAYTIIADPSGSTSVVPVATPALARAGTGDVLAGVIAGLLAQRLTPFQAASVGAYIHAKAGLLLEKEVGNSRSTLAGDLLTRISQVIN